MSYGFLRGAEDSLGALASNIICRKEKTQFGDFRRKAEEDFHIRILVYSISLQALAQTLGFVMRGEYSMQLDAKL